MALVFCLIMSMFGGFPSYILTEGGRGAGGISLSLSLSRVRYVHTWFAQLPAATVDLRVGCQGIYEAVIPLFSHRVFVILF